MRCHLIAKRMEKQHRFAQPLMDSFGIVGTVRMSFAVYNTTEEIDVFIDALKRVVAMLS